jgi:hypothetical protein
MSSKILRPCIQGFLLLAILWMGPACNKYALVDCETYDYDDCRTYPYLSGQLEVRVNFPEGIRQVPIVILRGQYPTADTMRMDTLFSETRTFTVEFDHYTVQAEYKMPERLIYAIDGAEISQRSYDVCDSVCWVVKDGKTDLRLKY